MGGWIRHHGSMLVVGGQLGKTSCSPILGGGICHTSWVSGGIGFKAFGKNEGAMYCNF